MDREYIKVSTELAEASKELHKLAELVKNTKRKYLNISAIKRQAKELNLKLKAAAEYLEKQEM